MSTLAEVIRDHHEEILRLWCSTAQRAAAARGLSGPELISLIGAYLSSLAQAGDELGRNSGRRRELVEGHLSSRLRQGFEIAEIVEEFALLGRSIASMWFDEPPSEQPDGREVERLLTELHLASVAVAEMFARHMLSDEQVEKHYGRRLRALATEALQPNAPPLTERFEQVVGLLAEAMTADSATLLLYDPRQHSLRLAAQLGAADAELARDGASLDPSTFVGRIAASDETTVVRDTATTELALSATLRQSGVRSLLGRRLPPQGDLLGVLYIGLSENRSYGARSVRRLELLGEQLTLHLENAKLYAALHEHIDALHVERDLRERFVAVLAHDLRGPLAAVKLNTALLENLSERESEARKLSTRINRNVDRADRMIRDLLDANRIHAGERLPLRVARCDLREVAREVVEELSAVHGPRFVLEAPVEVVGFWSADQLRRALWNLGTNAVKYGATGEPITIGVRATERGATASVHNFGAPIVAEEQKNLFEPFARTRSARSGSQRGWGLGLTLVHGFVEAHGGRVDIESTPETGTTFTLELPLDARSFQTEPEGKA